VLREAVLAGSRVRLRYASQRGTGNHLVDPWGLVSKAGIWYLVAAQRGKPPMYRVSRVAHVSVLAEPAARPPDLDLPAVWEQLREEIERPRVPPVRVTLRVRNDTAALVRRLVEPQLVEDPDTEGRPNTETADARDRADGPGWRRWVVTFRSLRAASGTLLGFGDAVEVLAPAALRTEMREVAAAVVRLYDGSALGVPDLGVPDLGISDD
jgi:predicted DNA-binding transcriptional regulator YafY